MELEANLAKKFREKEGTEERKKKRKQRRKKKKRKITKVRTK